MAAADVALPGPPESTEYQNVFWVICYGRVIVFLIS